MKNDRDARHNARRKTRAERSATSAFKRGSRPVSRVLSRAAIPLGCASPRLSSDLPGSSCGHTRRSPIRSCSGWGLPCRSVLPPARCALTAPFHPYLPLLAGGMFSVALSVGSRLPGVTWHPAQRSPDFPPRRVASAAARPTPGPSVSFRRPRSRALACEAGERRRELQRLRRRKLRGERRVDVARAGLVHRRLGGVARDDEDELAEQWDVVPERGVKLRERARANLFVHLGELAREHRGSVGAEKLDERAECGF